MPLPSDPFSTDDNTITRQWYYMVIGLLNRTGGVPGVDITTVQTTANDALSTANSAQSTANAAGTAAATAQSTADVANAGVAAETARAEAAEALLASLAGATFTGAVSAPEFVLTATPTWTGGAAVPSAVQPRGSMYSRTGGGVGTTLYVSQGAGVWNSVAGV
jgi:hypothetical protein